MASQRYEEWYAKLLLEELYPERYGKLVVADKPDLRDENNNVGIEVTDCTTKRERELLSLWSKMPSYDTDKQQKSIERMAQLGTEYQGGIQFWETKSYTSDLDNSPINAFFDAIECKLRLLDKGNYADCAICDLFVFSSIYIPNDLMDTTFNRIVELNNYRFRYIYLATNKNDLISFDTKTKNYVIRSFSEKQYNIAILADKLSKGEII